MASIPLPIVEMRPDAAGHPFPIQIAYQTQEFIQGALFYASFADIAAGETIAQPGGVEKVESRMRQNGLNRDITEQGWVLLNKYQSVFGSVIFQSVLITFCSHWDWYIRKLSRFILDAREELQLEPLAKATQATLKNPDRNSIRAQVEAVCTASESNLPLSNSEMQELIEMSLVRNLGLHNRWEVDEKYFRNTNTLPIGELRIIDVIELQRWHSLLIKLLQQTAINCSKSFNGATVFAI